MKKAENNNEETCWICRRTREEAWKDFGLSSDHDFIMNIPDADKVDRTQLVKNNPHIEYMQKRYFDKIRFCFVCMFLVKAATWSSIKEIPEKKVKKK